MASFNRVILMGNLTKDPRLSSIISGSAVCDFSIALNRRYTVNGQEKEEVCFVDIVVWGRQADSCGKYLRKGSAVFVEGRLKTDTWEDKEGNKRSRLRVVADRVQFLTPRGEGGKTIQSDDEREYPSISGGEAYFQSSHVRKHDVSGEQGKIEHAMPVPPQDVFLDEAEHEDDIPF